MKGISVIVCCFNSASRLPITLKFLALQKAPAGIPWEILIVNNASTDNTHEIALSEWASYNKDDVMFKVISQPVPGLRFAREKGVEESRYEYLVFCDDDNWLFEDYIINAFGVLKTWTTAAIVGGCGLAVPEVPPPQWFDTYRSYYAVGPQNKFNGIIPGTSPYVYGAGAVVRKSVMNQLNDLNFCPLATGRQNNKLSSGEDVELCYAVKLLDYDIGYSEGLKFYHFIPQNRLTENYFLKLVYQFGYCNILHRPYFWLFNPALSGLKRTWFWTLLISLNIYRISLAAFLKTRDTQGAFAAKVNLAHACGRLAAIVKLNYTVQQYYRLIRNKFKFHS
jgi:glycosyltransferase involved in cell wall biosynthesis